MKTIVVPAPEQVSPESQTILSQVQKRLGKIPNLYATIGYSSHALKGMLDFESALTASSLFTAKEREAVNLVVSQVNRCDYCLAAHTALAQLRGFSKADTLAIRRGEVSDPHLNLLIRLAGSIARQHGKPEPALLDRFFEAGYGEAALVEVIGLVSVRTFTNYVYAATAIPVDFPPAEPID